jgi:hypothetical protein
MLANLRWNSPSCQLNEWLLTCFSDDLPTIMLRIVNFMKCLNLHSVPSWLAEVVGGSRRTTSGSLIVGMMLHAAHRSQVPLAHTELCRNARGEIT